jgi:hypothetical protein
MDEIESILNRIGMSKEEFKERSEQHKKDSGYFDNNIDMLRRDYPNSWVAVYNEKIVAHHKNYVTLERQLKKKGIENSAVKMYIGTNPESWILSRIPSLSPV